jgi:hypothetical protein
VVAALFVLQPILGWIHHAIFLRVQHSTWWGFAHVWNGRLAIMLGIVNGGLGLQAADSTARWMWAYGVLAVVSFSCYIGIMFLLAYRGQRKNMDERAEVGQRLEEHDSHEL